MEFKDRIKEFRRIKASDLLANPLNYRKHPKQQRDALKKVLKDIGFAGAVLAREENGQLLLLDGHMRVETAGDAEVPVLILDLNEMEGRKLLATFDPLGDMAFKDQEMLNSLIDSIGGAAHDPFRPIPMVKTQEEIEQDMVREEEEIRQKNRLLSEGKELFGVKPGEVWRIRSASYIYCGGFEDEAFHNILKPSNPDHAKKKKWRIMLHAPRSTSQEYAAWNSIGSYCEEGYLFTNNNPQLISVATANRECSAIYSIVDESTQNMQLAIRYNKREPDGKFAPDNYKVREFKGKDKCLPRLIRGMRLPTPVGGSVSPTLSVHKAILAKRSWLKDNNYIPCYIIPSANTGVVVRAALDSGYCNVIAAEREPMMVEEIMRQVYAEPAGHNHQNREKMDPPIRVDTSSWNEP